MPHHLLLYDLAPDYLARRGAHRGVHLAHACAAVARGELVLAGETPEAAEAFARADPYVVNGLVTSWRVRRWTTVVGPLAAEPVA